MTSHSMPWIEVLGWTAAVCTFIAFSMKTMIPLRAAAIASNVLFIIYGALSGLLPVFVLHGVLLPFNIWRLIEMQRLIVEVGRAEEGSFDPRWLAAFMEEKSYKAGETLFAKGDVAEQAWLLLSGRVRFAESGHSAEAGKLIGDVGIFTPNSRRTLTCVAETDVTARALSYEAAIQLMLQNPRFGHHLVRIIVSGMHKHITALESRLQVVSS